MTRYASNTTVTVDKSKQEIEKILRRYGATAFLSGWSGRVASIGFEIAQRRIQLRMILPDPKGPEFTRTPARGNLRHPDDAAALWEKECRRLWRALCLVLKAKMEAVESGISTIEDEFLAWTCLPDGRTVGEALRPALGAANELPRLVADLEAEK